MEGLPRFAGTYRWIHAVHSVTGFCCLPKGPAGYWGLPACCGGEPSRSRSPYRRGTISSASPCCRLPRFSRRARLDQTLWSDVRINAWRNLSGEPAARSARGAPNPEDSASRCRCCPAPTTARSTAASVTSRTPRNLAPDGNSGIAGHRDGFFRGLKDIARGDTIELDTLHGTDVYRVERTWIVEPEDVSVLDPTPEPALTLVTCYPFYFRGSAPQRFIVRAVREGSTASLTVPVSCSGSRSTSAADAEMEKSICHVQ